MGILNIETLRSYDWASLDYAWLGWIIALGLAWGLIKVFLGRRWALPLASGERRPLGWAAFAAWLPLGPALRGPGAPAAGPAAAPERDLVLRILG